MKYHYRLKTIHIGQQKKILTIELPEELAVVETFLFSDIQNTGYWFLEALDNVLNRKTNFQEIEGNVCLLQITRDITTITDTLSEDEANNSCEIETIELKELIQIWMKVSKDFQEKENK